ncbi:MAG: HupE/UreJ family protein [Vicinamibacterales bacterium]
MRRLLLAVSAVLLSNVVCAHTAPFTYLDLRVERERVEVTLVAHVYDLAHELRLEMPTQLLDEAILDDRRADLVALLGARLTFGQPAAAVSWTTIKSLADRQSIALTGHVPKPAGSLPVHAQIFPYDPAHQTFVNVYEEGSLTLQTILDASKTSFVYFSGSTPLGILAVLRRFAADAVRHVFTGAEHWLVLVGLLLVGGGRRLVARILLALIAADFLTTALIVFGFAHPSSRLIDPALALSIVYVGADNLMVRGGHDMRPLIALAFGTLHGLWFGGTLAMMDLPKQALAWSLLSTDLGSIIAHSAAIAVIAGILVIVRQRGDQVSAWITGVGSTAVIVGGAYMFIQRVFFPGRWIWPN